LSNREASTISMNMDQRCLQMHSCIAAQEFLEAQIIASNEIKRPIKSHRFILGEKIRTLRQQTILRRLRWPLDVSSFRGIGSCYLPVSISKNEVRYIGLPQYKTGNINYISYFCGIIDSPRAGNYVLHFFLRRSGLDGALSLTLLASRTLKCNRRHYF